MSHRVSVTPLLYSRKAYPVIADLESINPLACFHSTTPNVKALQEPPRPIIQNTTRTMTTEEISAGLLQGTLNSFDLKLANEIFAYDIAMEVVNADEFRLTAALQSDEPVANLLNSQIVFHYKRIERIEEE